MGTVIEGKWTTRGLTRDEKGRFVRKAATFRDRIEAGGTFPPVAGRYHLYVSFACPWCQRVLLFHALKGLQEVISVTAANPYMGKEGWTFPAKGHPLEGLTQAYEIYVNSKSDYTGRATVPILWDTETNTIVSNESRDIMEMFDHVFDELTGNSNRYFPEGLTEEIDAMIDANYNTVNNGVYRAGFAGSQEAYEEAAKEVFQRLDELEDVLSKQRFLLGEHITAADWALFPTLYRFDAVYHVHFKCTQRRIQDYPNLWGYACDLFQQPGVPETCDMPVTREHYFTSHESINPHRLLPLDPEVDFSQPHDRASRF